MAGKEEMWRQAGTRLSVGRGPLGPGPIWEKVMAVLPAEVVRFLGKWWGSSLTVSCRRHECARKVTGIFPVWTRLHGMANSDAQVPCSTCDEMAGAKLEALGVAQYVLGPEVHGAETSPSPPEGLLQATVQDLPVETARRWAFTLWAHARMPGDTAGAELAVTTHLCVAPGCIRTQEHGCGLKHAHGLPPRLTPLVGAMSLNTDLLASWLHRSRHSGIKKWFSKHPHDRQLGSEGSATAPGLDLTANRMLVHFPSNNLWKGVVAKRVAEAVEASEQNAAALVFGDVAWFNSRHLQRVSITTLARSNIDLRRDPARCQGFPRRGQRLPKGAAQPMWGLWWMSKGPARDSIGVNWIKVVKTIRSTPGFSATPALEKLAEGDKESQMAELQRQRSEATARAEKAIASAIEDLAQARPGAAKERSKAWLRTVITQEHIRRMEKGDRDDEDLVRIILDHFEHPGDYFGDQEPKAMHANPDLSVKAGNGVVEWEQHFRAAAWSEIIRFGVHFPDGRLLRTAERRPWMLWWSPHLIAEQVESFSAEDKPGLEGSIKLSMKKEVNWTVGSNRIFVDVQAVDGILSLQAVYARKTLEFRIVTWEEFVDDDTIFSWNDRDPTDDPTTRCLTVIDALKMGLRTAPDGLGDGGAPADAEEEALEECKRTWFPAENPDWPDCTGPQEVESMLHPPIKVDFTSEDDVQDYQRRIAELRGTTNITMVVQQAAKELMMRQGGGPRVGGGRGGVNGRKTHKRKRPAMQVHEDLVLQHLRKVIKNCEARDGKAVGNCPVAIKLSRMLVFQCQLGFNGGQPFDDLAKLAALAIVTRTAEVCLRAEASKEKERRKLEDEARAIYRTDRSKAYADMTKPRTVPATCPLLTIVEEVRDRGALGPPGRPGEMEDTNAIFGPHYAPHPTEQYEPLDLMVRWDANMHPVLPGDPSPEPLPQPPATTSAQLAEWRASKVVGSDAWREWTEDGQPHIPAPLRVDVVWPARDFDYKEVADILTRRVLQDRGNGFDARQRDGSYRFVYKDQELLQELRTEGLLANGETPYIVIATDGSGSSTVEGDSSPCGFGTIIISQDTVTVILGGNTRSTSGLMELAAATAGTEHLQCIVTPGTVLVVSDYKSWVCANFARHRSQCFRNLQNIGSWQASTVSLEVLGRSSCEWQVLRVHAKSHEGGNGHWGQQLNEVADAMAKLARALANDLPVKLSNGDVLEHNARILPWRAPMPQGSWAADRAAAKRTCPVDVGEMEEARATRSSKGFDANGLNIQLAKMGGDEYIEAATEELNNHWYRGTLPSSRPDGTIIGKHSALQKVPSGLRHLCAPEVLQNIVSSVLGTRVTQMTVAGGVMNIAQKCNIPRIAGTAENNFLVQYVLFDFFEAARRGLLEDGAVRILMLSDISKAFDRAQLSVLLHSLKVLFPDEDITRLQATIDSLYTQTRIAVKKKKAVVLVEKLAGVHQGDPASAILFGLIMEFVRRLIPPSRRHKIRFYTSGGGCEVRVEIDYADDQIRVADRVDQMQDLVDALSEALRRVGLHWNPSKVLLIALKFTRAGGVHLFDPGITFGFDESGQQRLLKALLGLLPGEDLFKTLGIYLTWRGHAGPAGRDAERKGCARIGSVMQSAYPIYAKIDALRVTVLRSAEYLSFTAWVPQSALEAIDKEERMSLRAFLGCNVPNAVLMGPDFKLSTRVWRQEIIHLTGLIRALGSPDSRLKTAALAMTKFADNPGRGLPQDTPLLSPPFFGWREQELVLQEHPTATPMRYAFLAHRWGVGLEDRAGTLVVTLDSMVLEDPTQILTRLARKKEKLLLEDLLKRNSTDRKKNAENRQAPPYSISWGNTAQADRRRHEQTTFYGPTSPFSDTEIRILLKLRLLLWPTNMKAAILSGARVSARCYCGAICQTATHLLNVPWTARGHSSALRSLPRARHNTALKIIVDSMFSDGPERGSWKLVKAEGSQEHGVMEPHPDTQNIRTQIDRWVAEGVLRDEEGASHYKVDLVVAMSELRQIIIFDVCYGSDDSLGMEDALISGWRDQREGKEPHPEEPRFWTGTWFDNQGRMTQRGRDRMGPDMKQHMTFKHARYHRRYEQLRGRLEGLGAQGHKVLILPIALGVAGLIPEFTRRHLLRILGTKDMPQLIKSLIQCAQRFAIQVWRTWKAERRHPSTVPE